MIVLATALLGFVGIAKLPNIKPGWNLFSKDQDVQLGREAAQQYEGQLPLVTDEDVNSYLAGLGRRLTQSPMADKFPYTFKAVNDKNINAFALPGGPTYYNTGLFLHADNEAQLVGVMAHEISHVALRHGTNQVTKQYAIQIPAMILGGVAGGGIMGQLAQLGVGLGANGLLLKYSRNAERDADLYGAQIMAQAGYNPIEMARFFEKLEAQAGRGGGMAEWFQSHPSPGNRVKSVSAILPDIPQREFNTNTGQFQRIKEKVVGGRFQARPANKTPAGGGNVGPLPQPSSRLREFRNEAFRMEHPDNWESFADQNNPTVTIAPRAALLQNQQGGVEITQGVQVSYTEGQGRNLQEKVQNLIRELQRGNPTLQVQQNASQVRVDNQNGIMVRMTSSSARGGREADVLVATEYRGGIIYMLFITPEAEYGNLRELFNRMLASVQLNR